MGARHVTKQEFDFIKSEIPNYKYRKDLAVKVGRSITTVSNIESSKNYREYFDLRKGRKPLEVKEPKQSPVREKRPVPVIRKKVVVKNYDGAILAETARLRNALEENTGHLKESIQVQQKLLNPLFRVMPSEVQKVSKDEELTKQEIEELTHISSMDKLFFLLRIVVFIAIVYIGFRVIPTFF